MGEWVKVIDSFHRRPYFQRMLKSPDSMKSLEADAAGALQAVLSDVPAIHGVNVDIEPAGPDRGLDLIARFAVDGRPHMLVVEVKSTGQPRHVRAGLLQLRHYAEQLDAQATPVFVAPYLSEEARGLCREQGVGFLDLEGNCRIVFDGVFIERIVPTRPTIARRELKSLFKPKSAQVLRVLLRAPQRAWKVVDLAAAADVSLGHVSNVRTALLDREWAAVDHDGLRLTAPDALLDRWRDNYEPPAGERIAAYTPLHGEGLTKAIRAAADRPEGRVVLASFSAARWLAPYARTGTDYLYVDRAGHAALRQVMDIGPIARGANLEITVLKDEGLFRDAIEPAPGVHTTSPAQTYLDLAAAGERGREAAEHLRVSGLEWPR
jgi:hypothetical protein